jgi:hypothetical protein
MSKHTNLDINEATYLRVFHNLQHRTPRPATNSTKITMVNGQQNIISPVLAGRYAKSTKRATQ